MTNRKADKKGDEGGQKGDQADTVTNKKGRQRETSRTEAGDQRKQMTNKKGDKTGDKADTVTNKKGDKVSGSKRALLESIENPYSSLDKANTLRCIGENTGSPPVTQADQNLWGVCA